MAKKKKPEKKPSEPEEEETYTLDIEEEAAPEKPPQDESGGLKMLAIGILAILAIAFAYFFLNMSSFMFVAGEGVEEQEFKDIFSSAENIFVVMDVRGLPNGSTKQNILQCGVDFSGSSGMAGKNVMYYSLDDEGCITPDGLTENRYCFEQLENGITIYVTEGTRTTLHENGMVVGIGSDYAIGTCGIHRK
ncbi:hypothetical protein GF318_05715 [Candidatus Micrarchaeota archaeon]|nr:hypothetical protein [Candidatus Micrarchaeota archaeon]